MFILNSYTLLEYSILANIKSKSCCKKYGRIHKNREKNLQFYGVNESKIRWTVVEIKFIKGKNFNENWEA